MPSRRAAPRSRRGRHPRGLERARRSGPRTSSPSCGPRSRSPRSVLPAGGLALSCRAEGVPAAAWPFLVATSVIHAVYFYVLGRAYGSGEFSLVYPIARGLGVALVPLAAFFFLDERPSTLGALGVLLVVAGIVGINLSAARPARRRRRAPRPGRLRRGHGLGRSSPGSPSPPTRSWTRPGSRASTRSRIIAILGRGDELCSSRPPWCAGGRARRASGGPTGAPSWWPRRSTSPAISSCSSPFASRRPATWWRRARSPSCSRWLIGRLWFGEREGGAAARRRQPRAGRRDLRGAGALDAQSARISHSSPRRRSTEAAGAADSRTRKPGREQRAPPRPAATGNGRAVAALAQRVEAAEQGAARLENGAHHLHVVRAARGIDGAEARVLPHRVEGLGDSRRRA